MEINGFINVLKPPGMTSHDVIGYIRRIYRTKKVGHAGTLDPAAAGILVVAIGQATRALEYLTDTDKTYRAEVLLGVETDTGDDTGTVLAQRDFEMPTKERIVEVLKTFCGEIYQIPPAYSAIKINGQKACNLARKNIAVEIPPRKINIFDISLVGISSNSFCIDVHCSKGTYIRSLCVDIGKKLNIPSTMAFLVRMGIGNFTLAEANTLEEIINSPLKALNNMNYLIGCMADYEINEQTAIDFSQGKRIPYRENGSSDDVLLIRNGDIIIGIGKINRADKCIAPHKVFNSLTK
ncbi:tRNA pseudouridine(55) synthase TruB [Pectinatus sottacetonis]|uniref:tRNA pseudouridine(55) synthase TruB n=1 Tax=Pectinatus sottacetonis TaxID=1002795 RepID=UPI0018C4F9EF|nr:tRNA pseudouridine(55) synthase TruB [Pectinatus sottacetonis]